MNKIVHITGGCGYVGSRTAVALAKKGYKTVIIDKATPEERRAVLPVDSEYRKADLTDPAQAREALKDAAYVIQLAANIGPINYMWDKQAEILWENTAIDAAVYPAFQAAGTKLVMYSSTSMVHQHSPRYPYVETDLKDTPPPTNVYGYSKLGGEYFCRAYKQQYGGPDYVVIRFHNNYGPGDDSKGSTPGDIHVIPALIEKVLRGKYPLPLIGDPEATRPFTYIDDVVDAVVQLFEKALAGEEKVLNTDFNIASPEETRILDLAETTWRMFGDGRPFAFTAEETNASRTSSHRRAADISKLLSVIDWKPKLSLEEGIQKTADWVREVIARS